MQITKVEFFKTPFDNTYKDVVDMDYPTIAKFYSFFVNNFPHLTYTSPTNFTTKAVNQSDFFANIKFVFNSEIESLMEYNYCIINETKFFFINSYTSLNALTGAVTYSFNLSIDIWTTFYTSLATNLNMNFNGKIESKHQKLFSSVSGNVGTINKDFVLPDTQEIINKRQTLTTDDVIIWLKVKLKKPTKDLTYSYTAVATDSTTLASKNLDRSFLPYNDSPVIFYPIALLSTTYIFNLLKSDVIASIELNSKIYNCYNANDVLATGLDFHEYIDEIEITSFSPFIFKSRIDHVSPNYTELRVEVFNPLLTGFYVPAQIETSNNVTFPQGLIIDNYQNMAADGVYTKSKVLNTDNSNTKCTIPNVSADDILSTSNIKAVSVLLKNYPYKSKGFIYDGQTYHFIKKFVGTNTDAFTLKIKEYVDGHNFTVNLVNNSKTYKSETYDQSFETAQNLIPFSTSQKEAYIIANSNQIQEGLRHNKIQYMQAIVDSILGAGSGLIGSAEKEASIYTGEETLFTEDLAALNSLGGAVKASKSIANITRGYEDYLHFKNSIDALYNDLGNLPSLKKNSGIGGFTKSLIYGRLFAFEDVIIDDAFADKVAIDEYINGTPYGLIGNPFENVRETYDFVKTNNYSLKSKSIPKSVLNIISSIFNNGVRKWHSSAFNLTNKPHTAELNLYVRNFDKGA